MNVSGEMASAYDAICLSSFETVNKGRLVSADTDTGVVNWHDKTGNVCSATLGQSAIRIIPRVKR